MTRRISRMSSLTLFPTTKENGWIKSSQDELDLPETPRLKTRTCGARLTSSVSKFGGNFRRAFRAARPLKESVCLHRLNLFSEEKNLLVVFDPFFIILRQCI